MLSFIKEIDGTEEIVDAIKNSNESNLVATNEPTCLEDALVGNPSNIVVLEDFEDRTSKFNIL